ncbi:MAG: serine/threonine-protein kinase [Myxococcota bacterium]
MDAEHTMNPGLSRVCRLAEGGMGRVDLAVRHVGGFQRLYAVKRLHPHLASDPEFRDMFLDEARIAGHLRHPNIVGVLDVGEDDQGPYLVMDYVDGLPLSNVMRLARRAEEPMMVQLAVRVARAVAQGLHAAHEAVVNGERLELVHRDLTPQNIMIAWDGSVRITDFGIAKALGRTTRTKTGVVKGKMAYMAPEQLLSRQLDQRADLYSLGIVLFEMLSGERFHGRPGDEVGPLDVVHQPTPDIGEGRGDVPAALVQLLFEMLAKTPEARPTSAREVEKRLEQILAELLTREAPADLADYLDVVAGDVRSQQSRFVEQAIADAARSEQPRNERSRSWVVPAVAATIMLAAGTAWAIWPAPESEDEVAAEAPPAEASPRAVPSSAEDGRSTAVPAALPTASGPTGEAPPEPSPRMRNSRPRSATRSMNAMAEANSDDTTMNRLPDWVGW